MTAVPRAVYRSAFGRERLMPIYRLLSDLLASGEPPRVLVNSVPKAGTHVVSSILQRLPKMRYSGRVVSHELYSEGDVSGPASRSQLNVAKLEKTLAKVRSGTFVNGHLYWDARCHEILDGLEYRTIFITRDPRDILVSQLRYIESLKAHPRHQLFTSRYLTQDDRLMALIRGYSGEGTSRGMAPAGDRFSAYQGWASADGVLALRYESFLTGEHDSRPPGGDDEAAPLRGLVSTLADHVRRELTSDQLRYAVSAVGDVRSPTFRSGTTGEWRQVFTERHIQALRTQAVDPVVALGYQW